MSANTTQAAVQLVTTIAEAIRELKEVPSGQLYAQLMSVVDLSTYNMIIGILKNAQLVQEHNHLLTWVGPDPR